MNERITIAIADDHKLVTDNLKDFLRSNVICDILFIAKDGEELVHKIALKPPDILILDISMPKIDGIEALKIIKSRNPEQKVIVLSMYNDQSLLLKLIKLKVNGYISKGGPAKELLSAIEQVQNQGHFFTEKLVKAMYNKTAHIKTNNEKEVVFASLDDNDKKILGMICEEMTSKEMGVEMCMSARTIEGRRKKLLKQIGAKNQAGLVMYAIKHGIVKI